MSDYNSYITSNQVNIVNRHLIEITSTEYIHLILFAVLVERRGVSDVKRQILHYPTQCAKSVYVNTLTNSTMFYLNTLL